MRSSRGSVRNRRWIFWLVLWVLSGCSLFAVLWATRPYGPGAFYDSVVYLSIADGIRSGSGILLHSGEPAVTWPPGFPFAVAVVGATLQTDLLSAASATNGIVFAALVLSVGVLGGRVARSRSIGLLAAAAFVLSASQLHLALWIVSEHLFSVAYVGTAAAVARFVAVGRDRWAVVAGLTTAFAVLTRYVGIAFVPVCVLVLLSRGGQLGGRLRSVAAYLLSILIPVGGYLARNWYATGSPTGSREPATYGLVRAFRSLAEGLATWWVPTDQFRPGGGSWIVVVGLLVGISFAVAATVGVSHADPERRTFVCVLGLLALAGATLTVVAAIRVKVDPTFQRQVAPFFVGYVIVVAGAIGRKSASPAAPFGTGMKLVGIAVATLVAANLPAAVYRLATARSEGVGGLTTASAWASPFRSLVRAEVDGGATYSNASEIVFLETGTRVPYVPSVHQLEEMVDEAGPIRIVYFGAARYSRRPPELGAIEEKLAVETLARAPGGRILEVTIR